MWNLAGEIHNDCMDISVRLLLLTPDDEKIKYSIFSSDFCKIEYPNKQDRFIRVGLKQKKKSLLWEYGLWVFFGVKVLLYGYFKTIIMKIIKTQCWLTK